VDKALEDAAFGLCIEDRLDELMVMVASTPELSRCVDSLGEGLLHYAARGDAVGLAQDILRAGGKIDLANSRGSTPLHEAARYCATNVIPLLVVSGANLASKDHDGMTPMMVASVNRNCSQRELVQVFIRLGATLDLNTAVRLGNAYHVKTVLSTPGLWRELAPLPGELLVDAVSLIDIEMVRVLLECGVDPNTANSQGVTPLYRASGSPHIPIEIVSVLLEHGANPFQSVDGKTPLVAAREARRGDVIDRLEACQE